MATSLSTEEPHLPPESLYRNAGTLDYLKIQPPKPADHDIENEISDLRMALTPIPRKTRNWKAPPNHSPTEPSSLKIVLQDWESVTIMPTDKTNRFCTVNTSTCEEKIADHLRSGWEEIALDPTQPYENAANELLTRALNDIGIDRNSYLATRLKCRHSSPPGLYPLGKDHKASFPDCKLRIVQPVKGSAIERLDDDLITGKVLTQILPLLKYRVDSSQRFIKKMFISMGEKRRE